jgi:hypothetical protein
VLALMYESPPIEHGKALSTVFDLHLDSSASAVTRIK